MKTNHVPWILGLLLSASAHAKPPNGPPPGPPLMMILDTDRDGVLSENEIKDAAETIAEFDKNEDGQITVEELRMPPPPKDKRPVPPVIHALDTDRDGTISAEEMETAPESLKSLDKNGDGELSPEELRPPGPPPGDRRGPKDPPPPADEGAVE